MRSREIELEKILKALANRRRLAILGVIKSNRKISVKEISSKIKLSFRSTSKHLGILYSAGLVEREQNHFNVDYSLTSSLHKVAGYVISNL